MLASLTLRVSVRHFHAPHEEALNNPGSCPGLRIWDSGQWEGEAPAKPSKSSGLGKAVAHFAVSKVAISDVDPSRRSPRMGAEFKAVGLAPTSVHCCVRRGRQH